MTAFNPYRDWLELEADTSSPNYYQLLGIEADETDSAKISAAADRARSKVRSCRPGANAAAWSALLDELADAKKTLLDADARKTYDQQLAAGTLPARSTPESPAAEPQAPVDPNMLPPGMAPTPTPAPQTPAADAPQQSLPYPSQPGVSQATAPTAAPIAPTATPVAPTAAPVAQPTAPNPMDPMAPVGATASPQAPMATPVAAQPAATTPNPMDPMAPAGGVPQATAAPTASPIDPNAGVAIPVGPIPGGEVASEGPTVKGKNESLTNRNAPSKRAWQTPAIVGGVLLALMVVAGIVYMSMNGNNNTVAQTDNTETTDSADAANFPIDGVEPSTDNSEGELVDDAAEVDDMVEPIDIDDGGDAMELTDMTEVTPPPIDPPVDPPVPVDPPTDAELNTLADALTASTTALQAGDIALARESLQKAEPVAKLPEHKAMVKRVETLADHLSQYYAAIEKGLTQLKPGEEAAISHTVVTVKEAGSNGLTIDLAGAELNFETPADIPHALAKYVAEKGLDMNAPQSRAIIGSSHAILVDEQKRNEARGWFNQAAAGGADVSGMLALLDDQYESLRPEGSKPPEPPQPDPPTPAELAKLAAALKSAKLALTQDQYDPVAFAEQIAAAKMAAKLPQHMKMVANLESLGQYTKEYWIAVSAGLETLGGGTSIEIGDATIGIVEADATMLIIRINGENKTYSSPQRIPPGIARYCAEQGMNLNDPHSQAAMGAIYAVDAKDSNRAQAKEFFESAIAGGEDASKALAALSDDYDAVGP